MGTFANLLTQTDAIILDGALGTELEYQGYDVSGKLWSAKYLLSAPQVISDLHKTYLRAGADLLTTSTYQASLPGLEEAGLSRQEAEATISLTVQLAQEARESVWSQLSQTERASRPYPLIMGDVGPYAAYLADGSEYSGNYGEISLEELKDFHRPRIALLLAAGCDALALETVPNHLEALALSQLLAEDFPNSEAYLSVTTPDGQHLPDGTSLTVIGKIAEQSPQILAVGINCSAPSLISPGLAELRQETSKPLIAYPNSGEHYDGKTQSWSTGESDAYKLLDQSHIWQQGGAKIIGGCCRTRPSDIEDLAQHYHKP